MSKKTVALVLVIALTMAAISAVTASDSVVEKPDLKISINGIIGKYQDVPIIVNGRSMLPLRALLVNLGVVNDDSHIMWNDTEKSVTIHKDSIKVYLRVGSLIASINEALVALDAAPVNYKNRVYIPARFIAQSFGKKVAWDGTLNMVLIRDADQYDDIKAILEKSVTSLDSVHKYKLRETDVLTLKVGNEVFSRNTTADIRVDAVEELKHIFYTSTQTAPDNNAMKLNLEFFIKRDNTYLKSPFDGKWAKIYIDGAGELEKNLKIRDVISNETIFCGLNKETANGQEQILLKGNCNLEVLLNKYLEIEEINQYVLTDSEAVISINAATNLINYISLKVKGTTSSVEGGAGFNTDLVFSYSEYDGEFQVLIPDGLP